jgi:uncharacterized protein YjbI with pentapeptide repeats
VRLGWSDLKRVKVQVLLLVSILPLLLALTIATFPGEWLEEHLRSLPIVPTDWPTWGAESDQATNAAEKNRGIFAELKLRTAAALGSMGWTSPHQLLVAGEVNYVTGRPQSLWSNVLVLPNFELGDRVKFDAQGKVAISSDALSLRGRSLEGAVLVRAHLRKADFTGAFLAGANFRRADLREANFECDFIGDVPNCTSLEGAFLSEAKLQGALLAGADLRGASFDSAELQGAVLINAQLQGASLANAKLQGTLLDGAELQGALLDRAELQGASLEDARLQGASLEDAQLQGVSLEDAQLQGASLRHAFVWRTKPPKSENAAGALVEAPELGPKYLGLDCDIRPIKGCEWSEKSYEVLKSAIENSVPADSRPDGALKRIVTLGNPPDLKDKAPAKAWADLEEASSRSPKLYPETLAKTMEEIGCGTFVIDALIRQLDHRFENNRSQEAKVAVVFLDETKCFAARWLSEENKAKLQKIRDRGLAARSEPGAAR